MKHNFKKSLGQNFLSDSNLLSAIVNDAEVGIEDTIIEIGAGSGNLSTKIAEKAKKLFVFEIDESLKELLDEKFSNYSNTTLIMKDIMKVDIEEIDELVKGRYKVVANLPYYITTPIIFKFLENSDNLDSLTIMVQKEVAERIVAKPGTENYGALSVMVNYYGDPKITRQVNRKMFYPVPNVDSAVVRIVIKKDIDKSISKEVSKLVEAAFHMRRKTLVNNLCESLKFSKEDAINFLEEAGFDSKIRGEKLSFADFELLAKKLQNK